MPDQAHRSGVSAAVVYLPQKWFNKSADRDETGFRCAAGDRATQSLISAQAAHGPDGDAAHGRGTSEAQWYVNAVRPTELELGRTIAREQSPGGTIRFGTGRTISPADDAGAVRCRRAVAVRNAQHRVRRCPRARSCSPRWQRW